MKDLPRFAYYLYDIEQPKKEIAHMTAADDVAAWARLPEGSKVILQTIVGSTVHGTSVDKQDDRDEMAICIEPPEKVLGLSHFETMVYRTQPEGVRTCPTKPTALALTGFAFVRTCTRGRTRHRD